MTTVGVIGAGLIGGSICKSLRQSGLTDISVFSPSTRTQSEVLAAGFEVVDSVDSLVSSVDVLFVCVPLDKQMTVLKEIVDAISATSRTGLIVSDVSSVKGSDAHVAIEMFASVGATFVPGHPMAGTEHSGFAASTDDMFRGATWVLCPGQADQTSLSQLMTLVLATGARVSLLDVETHDAVVGSISHLPYVMAASLANIATMGDTASLAMQLAAGSFRDGTRVASSEPWLSTSMVMFNRHEVTRLITQLESEIHLLKESLNRNDNDAVMKIFERAQNARRLYEEMKNATATTGMTVAKADALPRILSECAHGALVSSLHVEGDTWTLQFLGGRSK